MRYSNNWLVLAKLSGCARALLDFLCEEMELDNLVDNNKRIKDKFISLLTNNADIHYAQGTVDKAYLELLDLKILLKEHENTRGTYMVNPEYFNKTPEVDRERLMKRFKEIESKNELAIIKSQIENK